MRLHTWRAPDLCLGLGLPWGLGSLPRNTQAHADESLRSAGGRRCKDEVLEKRVDAVSGQTQRKAEQPPPHRSSDTVSQGSRKRAL